MSNSPKILRIIARFLLVGSTAFTIILAVFITRLSQSPLTLDKWTTPLVKSWNYTHLDSAIDFQKITLQWDKGLHIHLEPITIDDKRHPWRATAKELDAFISLKSFLTFSFSPKIVSISHLDITVLEDESMPSPSSIPTPAYLQSTRNKGEWKDFFQKQTPRHFYRALRHFIKRLSSLQIESYTIHPSSSSAGWSIQGSASIDKKEEVSEDSKSFYFKTNASLKAAGSTSNIDINGSLSADTLKFALKFKNFSLLQAKTFYLTAPTPPLLSWFNVFKAPLHGSIEMKIEVGEEFPTFTATLQTGAGFLHLPEIWPKDIALEKAILRAALVDKKINVTSSLAIDQGAKIEAHGTLALDGQGTLEGVIYNQAVDTLKNYWPVQLAPDPRNWIIKNLSQGIVEKATISSTFKVNLNDSLGINLEKLQGDLLLKNIRVRYMDELPSVNNVNGTAHYDQHHFKINLTSGHTDHINIQKGTILITDLDKVDQFIKINLQVQSPTPDALTLLAHEPLAYPQEFGLEPHAVRGQTDVNLEFYFPLEKKLKLQDLQFKADGKLSDTIIVTKVKGNPLSITQADLKLTLNNKKLVIEGQGRINSAPSSVRWSEYVDKNHPKQRKIVIQSKLEPWIAETLGFSPGSFIKAGQAILNTQYVEKTNGQAALNLELDLTPASCNIPGLGWQKPLLTPAHLNCQVSFAAGEGWSVDTLHFKSLNDEIKGSLSFNGQNLSKLAIPLFKLGKTNINVNKATKTSPFLIQGAFLDLDWQSFPHSDSPEDAPLPLDLKINQVKLSNEYMLHNVQLKTIVNPEGKEYNLISLLALGDRGRFIKAVYKPTLPKGYELTVRSNDTGGLLKALDIYDNLQGGNLEIVGLDKGQGLAGRFTIEDATLKKAPVLAHLLSLVSITGIFDLLTMGEGIKFGHSYGQFKMEKGGIIKLDNLKAVSPSLGITMKGWINRKNKKIALSGSVIPAYMFNSLLSNIPIIGHLLGGGESGGGLFAASFNMKGNASDPQISVNPLSFLTPGFLRNLFSESEEKLPTAP